MKNRINEGIKVLGNAKTKDILPAAGWGLMDVLSGGKHTKHQNQKLADKVDDALGRPVRLARAKRAGLKTYTKNMEEAPKLRKHTQNMEYAKKAKKGT